LFTCSIMFEPRFLSFFLFVAESCCAPVAKDPYRCWAKPEFFPKLSPRVSLGRLDLDVLA